MIVASKTLEALYRLAGKDRVNLRPMWAYEVEMTRFNAAVFGITTKNSAGIRSLDLFYTVTAALILALALLIPSPTTYIPVHSLVAIALLGAVCGGRMIMRVSVLAPLLNSLIVISIRYSGSPAIIVYIIAMWLAVFIFQRFIYELYTMVMYFLIAISSDHIPGSYSIVRSGTGKYAHFPRIFGFTQLVAMAGFFVASWNVVTSATLAPYPYREVFEHFLTLVCFCVPQGICVAMIKREIDTANLYHHRMWENYRADVVDGTDTLKALIFGSILAFIFPCVGFGMLDGTFDVGMVITDSAISIGIFLASLCIFPVWRLLLSTGPGGGVMVTTPYVDRYETGIGR